MEDGHVHRLKNRLRVLSATTRAFAEATVDYDRLLETIASRLANDIGDCCVVLVASDDGQSLSPMAVHARPAEARER